MKKFLLLSIIFVLLTGLNTSVEAFGILSNNQDRSEKKIYKSEVKQIKDLLRSHNEYANKHDMDSLSVLYSDKYINNDGFDKKVYFESIKDTWDTCKDITYTTKIIDIKIDGDYASVEVEESAVGTLLETIELTAVAGEIHSTSTGIYHLTKVNGKWVISGETAITDDSSLLYGDARYTQIDLNAPNQVKAGDPYTVEVKIAADENTYIIGSINNDPVKYPPETPKNNLRAVSQSHTLERIVNSNNDNVNEYVVTTLAISRAKDVGFGSTRVTLTGLACIMKRVNVVPVNNFISREGIDENSNR